MLSAQAWYDYANPFSYLAGAAGKVVADGWTSAMLGVWNAGLWGMRLVLNLMDAFLTPDVSASGPAAVVYQTTFWIAGVLVVILAMIQLGVAAFRRDGKALATVLVGVAQFGLVWVAWVSYGVVVIAACGGLTRALMQALLRVDSWSAWQPWAAFGTEDIVDGTVATVLGLMGMLLWLAALGHLLAMLTRAGALLVLVATTPISAAGLVGDTGRAWFWKSLRWFHAAAFTPVLMVLVLGIGVQMTTGVATGFTDSTQAAIGTALPGVVLICIGCFAPLALFKLLAFVDPGTSSGAAMRQGLAAQGGLQGLFGSTSGGGESGAASSTDAQGRSQGEAAGQDSTNDRFTKASGGLLGAVGGAAGAVAAAGYSAMQTAGTQGAAVASDVTNQMGVGQHSYQPDFSGMAKKSQSSGPDQGEGKDGVSGGSDGSGASDGGDARGPAPGGSSPGQLSDPSTGATSPGRAAGGLDTPIPAPSTSGGGSPPPGQSTGGGGGGKGTPTVGGGAGAGGAGGASGGAAAAVAV